MHRIILLVLTCATGLIACSPEIDQKKFDDLYRAAKSIEGATQVGVTYNQFGQLLQKLATECVFRPKSAACSGPCRPAVPGDAGHPFRRKPATQRSEE